MLDPGSKILLSYLVGSIMGSIIMGHLRGGVDIRKMGSGNAGSTNALRTQGWLFAVGVIVIDVGKGILATALLPGMDLPFTDANPDIEVIPSNQVPDGDPAWASVLIPACRFLQLFTMAAEAAGPDLTPSTFEQAAYQLGSFELPGQPFNSLAPGKLDANDGMGLGIFDATIGTEGGLRELLPYISVTDG